MRREIDPARAGVNGFSPRWFSTFMHTMPERWTRAEVDGVCRRLPVGRFPRLLDVCCGTGRHAALLVERGYEVTGIDRDAEALRIARSAAPRARFVRLDQRDLATIGGEFDAVLILWQSFGYFEASANDRVLRDVASLLRPGGRLLLDLFHPDHLAAERGRAVAAPRGDGVAIENVLSGGRLLSTIRYADGATERMDFELFSPEELARRAGGAGFELLEQCCWWEEDRPPDPAVRRYQSVFQRP